MTRTARDPRDLRPVEIRLHTAPYAEGSCTIRTGNTRVLCTASVETGVPEWRAGRGSGWVTGEYAMLPRATHTRTRRERGRPRGRTQEIQRLIGRALRSVVDFEALGERTVTIDCDVLQADGGTRTAAITGGWVALELASRRMMGDGETSRPFVCEQVAAVSAGLVDDEPLLDLDYPEDSRARMDLNVVGTADGRLVEVQGTAEGTPVARTVVARLVDMALEGIAVLGGMQREVLEADA